MLSLPDNSAHFINLCFSKFSSELSSKYLLKNCPALGVRPHTVISDNEICLRRLGDAPRSLH